MRRSMIFVFVVGFALTFTVNDARADIWARGVSQAGGWFDAEKDSATTDDDLLCWAATAANINMWSGWDAGYANEDDVFDFYVAEDPVDAGGWMEYAWNFWFDGSQTGGHFGGSTHPGYYTTAEYTASYYEDMSGGSDVLDDIAALFQDDYGVGVSVYGGMAHAVTIWGLDTDASGNYLGVWMTDSDNNKSGPDPRPNTLDYYGVTLSGSTWYLDNFYGTSGINYIEHIQALAFVPIPAAVWLGFLGLSVAGMKLRKFA